VKKDPVTAFLKGFPDGSFHSLTQVSCALGREDKACPKPAPKSLFVASLKAGFKCCSLPGNKSPVCPHGSFGKHTLEICRPRCSQKRDETRLGLPWNRIATKDDQTVTLMILIRIHSLRDCGLHMDTLFFPSHRLCCSYDHCYQNENTVTYIPALAKVENSSQGIEKVRTP
jgi:hypothetical protein